MLTRLEPHEEYFSASLLHLLQEMKREKVPTKTEIFFKFNTKNRAFILLTRIQTCTPPSHSDWEELAAF